MDMLKLLALIRKLLGGRPPEPTPPPADEWWSVDVIALDSDGVTPIEGASVKLQYADGWQEKFTNKDGYTAWDVPSSLVESHVDIKAKGYKDFNAHLDVAGSHDGLKHNVFGLSRLVAGRTGLVRYDGFSFADDAGPYNALGATFFWGLWGWIHDRDRLADNLDFLKDRGVDYVRVLALVGPEGWSDRTVTPSDLDRLGEFTTAAYREHGLRVQWTIFGGIDTTPTRDDRRAAVNKVCDQLAGLGAAVQYVEVANEGWQNGFPGADGAEELRELGELVRMRLPDVQVALTAPQATTEEEVEKIYAGSAATCVGLHLERDTSGTGGMWRPVRQAWEMQFASPDDPRKNQEPIGPESSVEEDDDPLRLTMAAVLTWLCGGAGYVLHTGAGIRGGGKEDIDRGRSANFWEVANIEQTLAGIAASRKLLPAGLPNWKRHNTNKNYPDYPFEMELSAEGGWIYVDDGELLRSFAAVDGGGRVITGPIVATKAIPYVPKTSLRMTTYNPLTGAIVKGADVPAGKTYILDPTDAALIICDPL